MKNQSFITTLFCLLFTTYFSVAQTSQSATNPNNNRASVSLSWLNDVARIRVGGTGRGAENGFQIQGSGNRTFMRIMNDGKIGIGRNPSSKLDVNGDITIRTTRAGNSGRVILGSTNRAAISFIGNSSNAFFHVVHGISNNLQIRAGANPAQGGAIMDLKSNGKVGIGTSNPGRFRLAVNGPVFGKEIVCALSVAGADYVFKDDYRLPTLAEVEEHIKDKGHLPNVRSAKDMEANGIEVSEIAMKLLEKIEELTLYTIQQQKKIELLEASLQEIAQSKTE